MRKIDIARASKSAFNEWINMVGNPNKDGDEEILVLLGQWQEAEKLIFDFEAKYKTTASFPLYREKLVESIANLIHRKEL